MFAMSENSLLLLLLDMNSRLLECEKERGERRGWYGWGEKKRKIDRVTKEGKRQRENEGMKPLLLFFVFHSILPCLFVWRRHFLSLTLWIIDTAVSTVHGPDDERKERKKRKLTKESCERWRRRENEGSSSPTAGRRNRRDAREQQTIVP